MFQKRHISIPGWKLPASALLRRTLSGPKASRKLQTLSKSQYKTVQLGRDQKNLAIKKESFLWALDQTAAPGYPLIFPHHFICPQTSCLLCPPSATWPRWLSTASQPVSTRVGGDKGFLEVQLGGTAAGVVG